MDGHAKPRLARYNLASDGGRLKYTEQERLTALAIVSQTNSVTTAGRELGIPPTTIQSWKDSEEGEATIAQLRSAIRTEAAHLFAANAVLAARECNDRIREGDHHLTPDGDIVRIPLKAKDLAMISVMFTDKHALVTGTNKELTPANAQLLGIVERLLQMGQKVTQKVSDDHPEQAPDSKESTSGTIKVPENAGLDHEK